MSEKCIAKKIKDCIHRYTHAMNKKYAGNRNNLDPVESEYVYLSQG